MKKAKKMLISFMLVCLTLSVILINMPAYTSDNPEKKRVDLVVTKVGFNPIFYPIDNNKVPMPEGIDIRMVTAGYTQAELYTLSTDHGIVGILSNVNIGKAYNGGLKYKVIAPYYREGLGPDGRTMGQLIVSKDSDLNTLEDLYGKRVGIQGEADGSTIAMKTAMKNKYDLDLSKIDFVAIESEMAPILVEKGEIDAAMFDSDYILSASFDENYRTLMDFGADLYELYGTVPPAKFFVVRSDFYEEDPELYESVVDFFRKNYQWSLDNIEMITREEAEKTGEDYDFMLLKSKYSTRLDSITEKDIAVYEEFYKTAQDEGVIEKVPDLEQIFVIDR